MSVDQTCHISSSQPLKLLRFLLACRLHCLLGMTKQVNTGKVEMMNEERFQVTEQHKGKVLVSYTDKDGHKEDPMWITKGLLAKHFHESRVIGSLKGVWIVSL